MADRPILFSGPMVRALLAGTKTQTRRLLKPQPEPFTIKGTGAPCEVSLLHVEGDPLPRITLGNVITDQQVRCAVGDRLWVKETWRPFSIDISPWDLEVVYAADGESRVIKDGEFGENDWNFPKAAARGNVSSLFMTRWASRLTLTVTDVRVERLQDCSEQDAWAEGCAKGDPNNVGGFFPAEEPDPSGIGYRGWDNARDWYADLWDHINGEGAWEANPWVAAYTFNVHQGNIDAPA